MSVYEVFGYKRAQLHATEAKGSQNRNNSQCSKTLALKHYQVATGRRKELSGEKKHANVL